MFMFVGETKMNYTTIAIEYCTNTLSHIIDPRLFSKYYSVIEHNFHV